MSTGQPMYECTNCGDPVVRRGMCPECAEIRRGAAFWAREVTAEIRVACKVELPQHVEVLAPVPRIAVVATAESVQDAPKAVRAVPDMPREPRAAVVPAVAPRSEGRPQRVMELDPGAREGWCRILGCGRTSQARGLCSSCYWVATHREGLGHLMLPARCKHERGQAAAAVRAQVLAAVESTPGIGPAGLATAHTLPVSSVKRHLRELAAEGLIVAEHRGTYRAAGAASVAARNATDRLEELVRARGRIRRSEAATILEMSEKTMQSAVNNLRLRGRLLAPGKGKAATWLEVAR